MITHVREGSVDMRSLIRAAVRCIRKDHCPALWNDIDERVMLKSWRCLADQGLQGVISVNVQSKNESAYFAAFGCTDPIFPTAGALCVIDGPNQLHPEMLHAAVDAISRSKTAHRWSALWAIVPAGYQYLYDALAKSPGWELYCCNVEKLIQGECHNHFKSSNLLIHKAAPSDVEFLVDCLRHGIWNGLTDRQKHLLSFYKTHELASALLIECLAAVDPLILIAKLGDAQVGCAFVVGGVDPRTGQEKATLLDVYVQPEARDLGIATQITCEVEAYIRKGGRYRTLAGTVHGDPESARRICERLATAGWVLRTHRWVYIKVNH